MLSDSSPSLLPFPTIHSFLPSLPGMAPIQHFTKSTLNWHLNHNFFFSKSSLFLISLPFLTTLSCFTLERNYAILLPSNPIPPTLWDFCAFLLSLFLLLQLCDWTMTSTGILFVTLTHFQILVLNFSKLVIKTEPLNYHLNQDCDRLENPLGKPS